MEKKELKDKKNEIKEYKIEGTIILGIDHGYTSCFGLCHVLNYN